MTVVKKNNWRVLIKYRFKIMRRLIILFREIYPRKRHIKRASIKNEFTIDQKHELRWSMRVNLGLNEIFYLERR